MSINMKIESKDNSLFGTDYYRNSSIVVPRAYQPTAEFSVSLNKPGTNANVTLRTDDYVVASAEGRQFMTDRFIMTTKFNALQSVVAQVERERIFDEHVAILIASRTYMTTGKLPDSPLVIKALPAGIYA